MLIVLYSGKPAVGKATDDEEMGCIDLDQTVLEHGPWQVGTLAEADSGLVDLCRVVNLKGNFSQI